MSVPNTPISAQHSRHDRMLVARFAAGDAGSQEHEAQDLIRHCPECAALAADISAISKSVGQLPATPRTKDFRLSADQADHLRGSRFDRWLRTLTGSSWTTVRPVAAVALSIGLVMSVVGVLPMLSASGGSAGTASAPGDTFVAVVPSLGGTPESTDGGRSNSASSAPISAPVAAASGEFGVPPSPDQPIPGGAGVGAQSSASDTMDNAYVKATATAEPVTNPAPGRQPPQPSQAVAVAPPADHGNPLPPTTVQPSDALLIAGIGVSVLALVVLIGLYVVRRRYEDPLLR